MLILFYKNFPTWIRQAEINIELKFSLCINKFIDSYCIRQYNRLSQSRTESVCRNRRYAKLREDLDTYKYVFEDVLAVQPQQDQFRITVSRDTLKLYLVRRHLVIAR